MIIHNDAIFQHLLLHQYRSYCQSSILPITHCNVSSCTTIDKNHCFTTIIIFALNLLVKVALCSRTTTYLRAQVVVCHGTKLRVHSVVFVPISPSGSYFSRTNVAFLPLPERFVIARDIMCLMTVSRLLKRSPTNIQHPISNIHHPRLAKTMETS
jgi:hypothetical protein